MRKLFALSTLSLLLLTSLVHATDFKVPKQEIVGADKPIPLGELVMLSVTPPEKVDHLVSTSYTWKIFDAVVKDNNVVGFEEKRHAVDSEGRVFFGAGIKPKRMLVSVAVTHLYIVKDGGNVKEVGSKTVVLNTEVTIGELGPGPGPGPDPGPGPGPDPNPGPNLPDGRYALAKFAYDNATKLVPQDKRADASKALATSFRGMAAKVAAGTVQNAEQLLKETRASNDAALKAVGVANTNWNQWSEELMNKLYAIYSDGKISVMSDYVDAWREIATGLDAVK